MVLALVVALVLHGAWRVLRLPSPWPRLLLGSIGRLSGARRKITGAPLRGNVVYLANHLSWIDIPVLAGVTGCTFVAKAELRRVPLVGWLATLNHTLFVERGDRLAITRQVAELSAALAQGWTVAIFPEGTTGDGVTLLPFKPALLAALEPPPPGLMVQPIRIDYGAATTALAWVGDEPGHSHAARVLRRRETFDVNLEFLAPFDPAQVGGRKAVAAEARTRIEAVSN